MKILHVNAYFHNVSGAERYLFDICRALHEKGIEISVVSSTVESNCPGIRHYSIGSSYGFRSSIKMMGYYKELIKKENPDVIHLHNTQGYLSPFIINYLLKRKPVIKTIHDSRPVCPGGGWKVIPVSNAICSRSMGLRCFNNGCYPFYHKDRNPVLNIHKFLLMVYGLKSLKKMDRLLVASSFMYNDLMINRFDRENVSLIPLYTEKVDSYKSNPSGNSKKIILYVGRVERLKGIMQFIASLSLLNSGGWAAEVVGKGPVETEARELVRRKGLADRVRFIGFIQDRDIDRHYAGSSIVVVPSMYPEPFGLVGIEAMAFGRPVVAYDSGGIKDWLINNETGFLVKRGDVKELSTKISRLLEDPALAERMGAAARTRVEKSFRKELHIQKLLTIYSDVITSRSGTKKGRNEDLY